MKTWFFVAVLVSSIVGPSVIVDKHCAGAVLAMQQTAPQEPPRDPDDVHGPAGYCARKAGVAPNGQLIHPCLCHRMGDTDGEDCKPNPNSLDAQCTKHCSESRCQCPSVCSITDAPKGQRK